MGTKKTRTPTPSALDAVKTLIEERTKLEKWLEDLEAKKDSTPTKVFDRVRQDYLGRLQGVMDQLGAHTATLQDHAATLMKRLRELEAAEEAHHEEQAEAGLRAQVGEISSSEWESASRKAQRELAKLKEDQEVVADDLNRIRAILEGSLVTEDEGSETPKKAADFDELAFLKSVVGTTPGSSTPPVPLAKVAPQESAPAPAKATPVSSAAVPPASPPAASSPPPAQPPTQASAPPPAPPAAPADKPVETPAAKPADGALTSRKTENQLRIQATPEGPLAIRTSEVKEQPKTLKCAECGAMNYPSEWYCERCGAELAAL